MLKNDEQNGVALGSRLKAETTALTILHSAAVTVLTIGTGAGLA